MQVNKHDYMFCLLVLTCIASSSSLIEEYPEDIDADYTLECENLGSFTVSVGFPGGIEQCNLYLDTPGLAIISAGGENEVHFYSVTGSYWFDWDVDPDNEYPYGVACAPSHLYVNDESGNNDRAANMYRSSYNTNWEETNNPANDDGRGMSYDDVTGRIFEADDPYRVMHFLPGSSSGAYFDMSSYVSGDFIAGVATCDADEVFPDIGISGTAVVVCMRGNDDLWLFVRRTTGTWTFIDSCDMPSISQEYNQGITYQEETGYFYLANNSSGTTRVYKLDLSVEVPSNPPEIDRVNPSSSSVSIESGESINFQVSATDADGDLNFFEWYLDGTFMVNHSASGYSDSDEWSHAFSSPGSYHVDAFIYDDELNADSTYWNISVDANDPPTIVRVSPSQQNVTIAQGTTVEFVAEATDLEGALNFFEWYIDDDFQCNHPTSGTTAQDTWEQTFNCVDDMAISCYIYDDALNEDFVIWDITVEPLDLYPEYFDDFIYSSTGEMSSSICCWAFAEGTGGPGSGTWTEGLVMLLEDPDDSEDKIATLNATCDGYPPTIFKSGFYTPFSFMYGTYAARVFLRDEPYNSGPDGDVILETFYLSSPYIEYDPLFCEYDFEYLPNSWSLNGDPEMDLVSWEMAPAQGGDRIYNVINESFAGWHILVIHIDADSVRYSIDGEQLWSSGGKYQPESLMSMWFNIWYDETLFLPDNRYYRHDIDWVYHVEDELIDVDLIQGIVDYYSDTSVERINDFATPIVEMEEQTIPRSLFHGIFPNPTHGFLAISFELSFLSSVNISLYDLYGRKVDEIWNAESVEGITTISWNASSVPSGMYFVKFQSDQLVATERVVIID